MVRHSWVLNRVKHFRLYERAGNHDGLTSVNCVHDIAQCTTFVRGSVLVGKDGYEHA